MKLLKLTKLSQVSIELKASFSFLIIICIGIGSIAVTMVVLHQMNDAAKELQTRRLASTFSLGQINAVLLEHQNSTVHYALAEPDELADIKFELTEIDKSLAREFAEYEALVTSEEEKQFIAFFKRELKNYLFIAADVMAEAEAGEQKVALEIALYDGKDAFGSLKSILDRNISLNMATARELSEDSAQLFARGQIIVLSGAALLMAATFISLLMTRKTVVSPIRAMTGAMRQLANGDMAVEIPSIGRHDEIGQMADAVSIFKDSMRQSAQLAEEKRVARQARMARAKELEDLALGFDATATTLLKTVASSVVQTDEIAQSMVQDAEKTLSRAQMVAEETKLASENVTTVAEAARELNASISEIRHDIDASSIIAREAEQQAHHADATVARLTEAVDRINNVLSLISVIASQTNLLALNANIEASRAGEVGKGFTVVANEVKTLAKRTAEATEEITDQISAVHDATADVVSSISGIVHRISEINQTATRVSEAMETQSSATDAIAGNVQRAAEGTEKIAETIQEVTQAAATAGQSSGLVLEASQSLTGQTESLRSEVQSFLTKIRAA